MYSPRADKNEPWSSHRIEIQTRVQLQDAYATAVETVSTFTKSPIKVGDGHEDWKRSFALVGSALAMREGTTLVEDTPSDPSELTANLKVLASKVKVNKRLRGWKDIRIGADLLVSSGMRHAGPGIATSTTWHSVFTGRCVTR